MMLNTMTRFMISKDLGFGSSCHGAGDTNPTVGSMPGLAQ